MMQHDDKAKAENSSDQVQADTHPHDHLAVGPYAHGYSHGGHAHDGFLSAKAAEEGTQAVAGHPLALGAAKAEEAHIMAALQTIYDPEIPVNIYDLGLIYDSVIDDQGDVAITMTLTAPACPVAGEMPQRVADTVAATMGVGVVTVTLTWVPPWRSDMMSEDARMALDFF